MKRIPFLIFILLFPFIGFAQTSGRDLTLRDAISLALGNNPAIHASQLNTSIAQSKADEAAANRLPSVKISGGYTRQSSIDPFSIQLPIPGFKPLALFPDITNVYSSRVTVQQPIFTGFRLAENQHAAELSSRASSFDFERDKRDLIFSVTSAYWNLARAIDTKKVIEQNVRLMQQHLDDVQNMSTAGLATSNDVLKVKVQYSSTELLLIDIETSIENAQMALNALLGLPISTQISPTTVPDQASQNFQGMDSAVAVAFGSRPEIQSSSLKIEAANSGIAIARSSWYPQIFFTGNYVYARPNPRIIPPKDEFTGTWDLGINLSWDIWNWGITSRQTERAVAQSEQMRDADRQLRDGITMEVRSAILSYRAALKKIDVAQTGVQQAEDNYRILKNKFETQLATSTDLLDAEVALLQAGLNRSAARMDAQIALAKAEKSLGIESR